MNSAGWDEISVVVAGFSTLAIFSFLIKENKFYRFFEHLFIGLAAGLSPVSTLRDFLWPNVVDPMLGNNILQFPDGTYSEVYQPLNLLYLLPLIFGLLYYTVFIARWSWMAKLVIGFSLGAAGGMSFKGIFNEVIPQIAGSFKPLIYSNATGTGLNINNIIFVFTLLTVMYYFFFTFKRTGQGSKVIHRSGRWLMMVCFGAFFGSTVMARLALLIERINFLTDDWRIAISTLYRSIIG